MHVPDHSAKRRKPEYQQPSSPSHRSGRYTASELVLLSISTAQRSSYLPSGQWTINLADCKTEDAAKDLSHVSMSCLHEPNNNQTYSCESVVPQRRPQGLLPLGVPQRVDKQQCWKYACLEDSEEEAYRGKTCKVTARSHTTDNPSPCKQSPTDIATQWYLSQQPYSGHLHRQVA